MVTLMGRRTDFDARNYDRAILLLSQACFKRHQGATSADFIDAMALAIGRSLDERSAMVMVLLIVIDQTDWLQDQTDRDIFVGRFVREYAALSRKGRNKGLAGLDLSEIEMLPSLFPPLSSRDKERLLKEREINKASAVRRPCIALLDEALDTGSALFESIRMVMSERNTDKAACYISSYVRYMLSQGESDAAIGRRLKIALMSPRKTTRKQGEARK